MAVAERGARVARRHRGTADRLSGVAGADDVSVLPGQRLDQGAVSGTRVLELVDHHLTKAHGEGGSDVGALAKEPFQDDHQVASVEAARLAQHTLVARIEVGELELPSG